MSLDSIPTLPRSQNVSGDDLLPIIDMSDRRSPKAVTLSDAVAAAGGAAINSALDGETLEVVGVTLTDTTGTTLQAGTLGLNDLGGLVVHDGESNGEDLPSLVDSVKLNLFDILIPAVSMNNEELASFHVLDVVLNGSQATSGNTLSISGRISCKWSSSNKPDGGAFLVACLEGENPLVNSYGYQIATGVTSEMRHFDLLISLQADGDNFNLSFNNTSPNAIVQKNSSGTITHSAEWTNADEAAAGPPSGVSGEPNKLRFYILTVDSSGTVSSSLLISGFLSLRLV